MKDKYVITAHALNAEYPLTEDLENGTAADGFMLLTFRNEKPCATFLCGVSVSQIADMLGHDEDPTVSAVLQAMAIRKGMRKAQKIRDAGLAKRETSSNGGGLMGLLELLRRKSEEPDENTDE